MSQQREIRQSYLRNLLQEQDQMHLTQNGYNHNNPYQMNLNFNNNILQQQQYTIQDEQNVSSASTSTKSSQMNINNNTEGGNCMEKPKKSNEKLDTIPQEIYDLFKKVSNLKKQTTKATLKKWHAQCKEEEHNHSYSVSQYHKRQEVDKRTLKFSAMQTKFYNSTKVNNQPSEQDLALFISCLNCYDQNKAKLRLCFDDGANISAQNNNMQSHQKLYEQLFLITIKNQIFQDLKELSFQVLTGHLNNQSFFQTCVSYLDFRNLSYLQLSFINQTNDAKLFIQGDQLSNLSFRLKRLCSRLNYLVLEFQEVSLEQQDFQNFTENIMELKDLIFIDLCFKNTRSISTEDITRLLRGLTIYTKTHIDLSFPDAQIEINEDLYQVISTLLDLPQMYFLKSLTLNFSVLFPEEKQNYSKQIIAQISEQIFNNTTPYLNDLKLFIKLPLNILRLLDLKSFNFQKIWIQLLKMKKLGLLNRFRKEIAWELSEFQELFIF